MAASAFTLFSNAVLEITKGQINLSADTFAVVLLTSAWTPAPNTNTLWSDISANELAAGSGYTAGGVVLASETDTLSTATVAFTGGNPSWASFSAGPFRYAAIVRRAGASLVAGDLLLCYSDLTGGGTITGTGGSYTLTLNTSGIFTVTHSP